MTRKLFDSMDADSKRFYSKILNTAVLNLHAVKRGWFDVLICETTDAGVLHRWREAVPQIVLLIKAENTKED
ncbi:hypothetical protein [Acinetobacter sp.]|uniref:hypothetical protein n=1 Tax=Acinetobacter sp. TaxID=472 RepID=UPI00388FE6BD